MRRIAARHKLGGHSGGETPLPIPNREVKPASADGTRRAISRESRTPPIFFRAAGSDRVRPRVRGPLAAQAARSFSRHSGSSSRSRRTRSPSGGWVSKSAAEALVRERVRRVERLRRRARLERDEPHRLLEPQQRVREAVRRAAELGREAVCVVLALRREHQVDERRRERAEHEQERRAGSSRRAARLDDRCREIDHDRLRRARRGCGGARARARRSPRAPPASRRRAARPRPRAPHRRCAPRPAESARG